MGGWVGRFMRLDHLSLTNFRNYARLEFNLPSECPVVLCGENAQGKTSALEAIYYLATSSSPYTTSDRQLIHWRTEGDPIPFARLSGELSNLRGAYHKLDITLMLDMSSGAPRFKKSVKLNNVEKRVMDVVGMLNVVLFLPQDLSLVEGSPNDRRRFMNATLTQVDVDYFLALNEFEKILPQRNALLRRIAEKRAHAVELEFWDQQLASHGAVIIAGRQRFLRELELKARDTHHALSGGRETLSLKYLPSILPVAETEGRQLSFDVHGLDLNRQLSPDEIKPQFMERLLTQRPEAIRRGVTVAGPHRDELRLFHQRSRLRLVWQPGTGAHRRDGAEIRRVGMDARSAGGIPALSVGRSGRRIGQQTAPLSARPAGWAGANFVNDD